MPCIVTLSVFSLVLSTTWHPGLSQRRPLFVDSPEQVARSQNRTKCVKYVWLSYPTWPSRWVLCISMQWLRLKGCHATCDEWTSGEICSLQHMWVTGSVMWAAASDESLKFGVQGASATNWILRVTGARDNGIRLYCVYSYVLLITFGICFFSKYWQHSGCRRLHQHDRPIILPSDLDQGRRGHRGTSPWSQRHVCEM